MTLHMLDMTLDELRQALAEAGHKPYRADQLADWVYNKGVVDPGKMSNMPAETAGLFDVLTSRVVRRSESADGCVKLLLELHDGHRIETVLIPAGPRATACVSTQVGCAMGCAFCASGLDSLARNLTGAEILEQVLHIQLDAGRPVTNVVFMGMGEPLANYAATLAAIRALVDPERFGISARRITVSTVGLPDQIRKLAKEDLPITLAISLHAPNDAIRSELIPSARRYSLEDILDAAREFYEARNREITLEYVLLGGLNDSILCADALAKLTRRLRCNVNVIGYNPVSPLPFERPTPAALTAFAARLKARGVNVTVRHSRGLSDDSACGQLRRRSANDGDGTR